MKFKYCLRCFKKSYEEKNKGKAPEILNLRKYINNILNNLPEQNFDCVVLSKFNFNFNFNPFLKFKKTPDCGRKFRTNEELQKHMERRHKDK